MIDQRHWALVTRRVTARFKRVVRNLNKAKHLRYVGWVILTLPILLPLSLASASDQGQPPTQRIESTVPVQLVSLTPQIVEATAPTATIEVASSSPYLDEQKAKAAAQKRLVQAVAVAKTPSIEPSADEKRLWVQRAASTHAIDWKILEAVWQIESGKTWKTGVQSYAGAHGPCQFMPGTWRHYAQDGNGDGTKDATDARDCLFGAAKLLASNGAASGDVVRALFSYNHSMAYVQKVLRIASTI